MALTNAMVREILSKAGVDSDHMSEAVREIAAGNTASVEALREEIANLKQSVSAKDEELAALKGVQKELEDLKTQVEADAKSREGKDWDKLKAEFDGYKEEIKKRDAHAAKLAAFREILKDADMEEKYHEKIIKYSDIDSIELDADGKVKDAKDRIKAVKEEWPEYKVTTGTRGAEVTNPPANTGGSKSKEEIEKITDRAERQKAIAENHELFGF
jgi:hypothetical protein